MELVESSMVEPVGLKVSMVGAVELSCQEKLRQRSLRERILEVQVDYFFLGLVESKFKLILLRQVFFRLFSRLQVPHRTMATEHPPTSSTLPFAAAQPRQGGD